MAYGVNVPNTIDDNNHDDDDKSHDDDDKSHDDDDNGDDTDNDRSGANLGAH